MQTLQRRCQHRFIEDCEALGATLQKRHLSPDGERFRVPTQACCNRWRMHRREHWRPFASHDS